MIEINKEDIKVGDYVVSGNINGMETFEDKIVGIENNTIYCHAEKNDTIIRFDFNGFSKSGFYKIIKFLRDDSTMKQEKNTEMKINKKDIKVGDYVVSKTVEGNNVYEDKITEITEDKIICGEKEDNVVIFNFNGFSEHGFFKIIEIIKKSIIKLGDDIIYKDIEGNRFIREVIEIFEDRKTIFVQHNVNQLIEFNIETKISYKRDFIITEILYR